MKTSLYLSCALAVSALPAAAGADAIRAPSSLHAFEHAVTAARDAGSGGGATVTRAELRSAIAYFLFDDGALDSSERAHLTAFVASPASFEVLSGAARSYAVDFLELHGDGDDAGAGLVVVEPQRWAAELAADAGAPGPLLASLNLLEARATRGGVSAAALRATFNRAFNASAGAFDPINQRELSNELSGRLALGTPSSDEVSAVARYLGRGASRFYLATWIGRGRGGERGDIGGVVVAAVSADRRFVRFVEVHAWSE